MYVQCDTSVLINTKHHSLRINGFRNICSVRHLPKILMEFLSLKLRKVLCNIISFS